MSRGARSWPIGPHPPVGEPGPIVYDARLAAAFDDLPPELDEDWDFHNEQALIEALDVRDYVVSARSIRGQPFNGLGVSFTLARLHRDRGRSRCLAVGLHRPKR